MSAEGAVLVLVAWSMVMVSRVRARTTLLAEALDVHAIRMLRLAGGATGRREKHLVTGGKQRRGKVERSVDDAPPPGEHSKWSVLLVHESAERRWMPQESGSNESNAEPLWGARTGARKPATTSGTRPGRPHPPRMRLRRAARAANPPRIAPRPAFREEKRSPPSPRATGARAEAVRRAFSRTRVVRAGLFRSA